MIIQKTTEQWNTIVKEKDDRIKQEGTQQSKMIQQRQTDSPAINFNAEAGIDMSAFM